MTSAEWCYCITLTKCLNDVDYEGDDITKGDEMKTTAHKFKKNPNCVYRHADLGGVVTIEHSHYPDKVFELTARDGRPFKVGDRVELTSAGLEKLEEKE